MVLPSLGIMNLKAYAVPPTEYGCRVIVPNKRSAIFISKITCKTCNLYSVFQKVLLIL